VRLDRGEDILALDQLDQKLWGALSCPIAGLEFDERTLRFIDADGDGRIRAPEVIAAAKWAGEILADPSDLVAGGDSLSLDRIAADRPQGRQILASARHILRGLGREDATSISLADVADLATIYSKLKFNGDGIIPPSSADDPEVARVIQEIIDTVGGAVDRSGEVGVDQEKVEAFFREAQDFSDWWKKADADRETLLPLGDRTAAAAAIVAEVQAKVDDWFARSRLVAFDERALFSLNRDEDEYKSIAASLLSAEGDEVASFPLAKVTPSLELPLDEGINPAWAGRIEALRRDVIAPLLGERSLLSADDWAEVLRRLAPYRTWAAEKGGAVVEKLGPERLQELLDGGSREAVEALVAQDKALEQEIADMESVERLLRYLRDFYTLLCNFVSFTDFYSKRKAVFQAGTLYLDQRSCELCIRVTDAGAHAAIAAASQAYLAYCECTRKSDGKKMIIAAAFTDGDSDNLAVGRNGIFYDRQGADWDATIIKVVENPISIREAFWLPYKRLGKLIGDQINRLAAAQDQKLQESATAKVDGVGSAVEAGAPAPAKEQSFDVAKFAGIFAAIGLAIGAIGSTLAAVLSGFLGLSWWKMPLAIFGLMMLISGPSMILAWLKLRRRSLGPILDAAGWAVNTHAKINLPFGASLTAVATLPPNAERSLHDPFAPKRNPWPAYAAILLLLGAGAYAWYAGHLQRWFGSEQAEVPVAAEQATDAAATPAKAPADTAAEE